VIFLFLVVPLYIAKFLSMAVMFLMLFSMIDLILRMISIKVVIERTFRLSFSIILAIIIYNFTFDIRVVGIDAREGWKLVGMDFSLFRNGLVAAISFSTLNFLLFKFVKTKTGNASTQHQKIDDHEFAKLLKKRELKAENTADNKIVSIGYEQSIARFYMIIFDREANKSFDKEYFFNLDLLKQAIAKQTNFEPDDFWFESKKSQLST
jgi:hypothetical protein